MTVLELHNQHQQLSARPRQLQADVQQLIRNLREAGATDDAVAAVEYEFSTLLGGGSAVTKRDDWAGTTDPADVPTEMRWRLGMPRIAVPPKKAAPVGR
jgi:hypothetical protein